MYKWLRRPRTPNKTGLCTQNLCSKTAVEENIYNVKVEGSGRVTHRNQKFVCKFYAPSLNRNSCKAQRSSFRQIRHFGHIICYWGQHITLQECWKTQWIGQCTCIEKPSSSNSSDSSHSIQWAASTVSTHVNGVTHTVEWTCPSAWACSIAWPLTCNVSTS